MKWVAEVCQMGGRNHALGATPAVAAGVEQKPSRLGGVVELKDDIHTGQGTQSLRQRSPSLGNHNQSLLARRRTPKKLLMCIGNYLARNTRWRVRVHIQSASAAKIENIKFIEFLPLGCVGDTRINRLV